MLIASMQFEIFLPQTASLKEKRFVIKSLITKIRNKFNVSIAEVDFLDKWQRTCLGAAFVSNERQFLDKVYTSILNILHQEDRIEVIDQIFEVL
jgi:uncharacterized protein YlxP (DUF503 family)